jgi:two-component system sensor histidine kinase YesM
MPRFIGRIADSIRSRLAARFFVVVAVAVVVPACLLFVAGLALFEGAVRQSVDGELRSSLDRTERDLTQFLADLVAVSGVLANDEEIRRALVSDSPEYERSRMVDRDASAVLAAIPGRDSIRYTILGQGRIYSSWSRNFNDYSFLADLPIVRKAASQSGHLVWEGFGSSFVKEEGENELLVSVARSMPAEQGEPSGVVILQAEREAFRKFFRERRGSSSFSAVILTHGAPLVDTASVPVAKATLEAVTRLAAGLSPEGKDSSGLRTGGYLATGRRLAGLPAELREQDWSLVVLYDYGDLAHRFASLRALFAPSFIVLLLSALAGSYVAARKIVKPISRLSRRMEAWSPDDPVPDAPGDIAMPARQDEIGMLDRSFQRLERKVGELIASLQREHAIKELYRYRALSAQLNPHFLFNSLNSLRWMAILRKADNMVEALDHLSGLLSYSMGKGGDHSTLRGELESVESYLAIQNIRYGGRFVLARNVPEELLGTQVLRFMLQPLVENSVLHGYRGVSSEGLIEVSARIEEGVLVVEVSDRGRGPGQEKVGRIPRNSGPDPADAGADAAVETGLGMANVRDMLAITCGEGAALELLPRDGGGAVVRIRIPQLACGGGT